MNSSMLQRLASVKSTEELNKLKRNLIPAKNEQEAFKRDYDFWYTQPIPKLSEHISKSNYILDNATTSEHLNKEQKAPKYYEWKRFNVDNESDIDKIYNFLNKYYVDDLTAKFKLSYSKNFLQYNLSMDTVNIGLVVEKTQTLSAFISGYISTFVIDNTEVKMPIINYLCIHPKLRNQNLAALLIKELGRIITCEKSCYQAIYKTTRYIPKPITQVQYYHRPLNFKKLLNIGFCNCENNIDSKLMEQSFKLYGSLPNNYYVMQESDISQCCNLLNEYLKKYTIYQKFSLEQFKNIFYNNAHVRCLIVKNKNDIIDFVSYYKLNIKITKSNDTITEAFCYYYTSNQESTYNLIKNVLIDAQQQNCDVFNALNIMENMQFIEAHNFISSSELTYYNLYNWKMPNLQSSSVGVVLI